jgi:UrcA family protein
MKLALIAITGALTAATAVPAAAETNRYVPVADLDLSSAQGRAALTDRLERAAWQVCLYDDAGALRSPEKQAACARDAHKETAQQVAAITTQQRFARR